MLYMSGMLEMYEQLIGHMLKQLPTPSPKTAASAGRGAATAAAAAASDAVMGAGGDVRKQLSYILKKVQDLRKHHYHEQDQFLQGLKALRHIPVEALCMIIVALCKVYGKAYGKVVEDLRTSYRRLEAWFREGSCRL